MGSKDMKTYKQLFNDEQRFVEEVFYDALIKFGRRGIHIEPTDSDAEAFKEALAILYESQRPVPLGQNVNLQV